MDTSSWRVRVLLEPRGFMRAIEVILAIVAFATTGGYHSTAEYTIKCNATSTKTFTATVDYPFNLHTQPVTFTNCSDNSATFIMEGDLSPSAQWFMFVAVTAFLYALGSVVFYVMFDATVRQTHERIVTIGDLAGTVIYAFFWLTAASAWAWGLGQVKVWTGSDKVFKSDALSICRSGVQGVCTQTQFYDYSPLNASVAFAFLNFFLWVCNVWFVYKESPYHMEPDKQPNQSQPPPQNFQ